MGTYIRELAAAIPAADPAVELVPFRTRFRSDRVVRWTVPPGGVVVPASLRTMYPAWNLLGRPHLPRALDGCAVVHATSHAAVPPVRGGQRLVVTIHDLAFDVSPELFPATWRWLYRAGVRAAVRRAGAIITPSAATARDLHERYAVDPSRVHVIPLASSLAASGGDAAATIAPLGVRPPFVLFAGTLEPRKNVERLIRAYRRVAAGGLPHALVLAGPDGWGVGAIAAEIDAGGAGTVIRLGRVEPADLDALYRAADVVAYPSLYEGFGLPVVEAMARGVPVVTSRVSSIPEVGGDAVVYVDPADEGSIADGLERVLRDEALSADLRRRGPERASGFSWEATARATLDVYRRLAGESAKDVT